MASYGGVTFRIIQTGGRFPQWNPGAARWSEIPVPGTNDTIKQYLGSLDDRLSIQALVGGPADVAALIALRGTAKRTLTDYPGAAGLLAYTNVYLMQVEQPVWLVGASPESTVVSLEFGRQATL